MGRKKEIDFSTWGSPAASEQVVKGIIGAGEQGQAALIRTSEEAPQGKGRPKVTDRETKKRVTLAIFPSVYESLQKIAYVNRQSASDVVTELIAGYVKANADKLKEYDKIKGE